MNAASKEKSVPEPPPLDVLSVYAAGLTRVQAKHGFDEEAPKNRSYLEFSLQRVTDTLTQYGASDRDARIFTLGLRTGMISLAKTLQLPEDTAPETSDIQP